MKRPADPQSALEYEMQFALTVTQLHSVSVLLHNSNHSDNARPQIIHTIRSPRKETARLFLQNVFPTLIKKKKTKYLHT